MGEPGADEQLRILLVDDHPVVRDGLRGMLGQQPDLRVVGEAATGDEALALVARTEPHVVLTDLRMPGLGGPDTIRRLVAAAPTVRVLVLTTYDGDADIVPAIEAGATGYLLKDVPREELFRAIRSVARGETVLAPTVAARLVGRLRAPPQDSARRLSDRECEVLAAVARGRSNLEIAEELFVAESTVKTHLVHIFGKLDVGDRAAAVATAYELGLLPR